MNNAITIISLNISEKVGTVKLPVNEVEITFSGLTGDAHAGPWNRQVSLLGKESIDKFEKETGRKISFGDFAENITTQGIELWKTKPLDRFIGEGVELEVTQIGKECHGTSCTIYREVGKCVMPKEGIFCRVVKSGRLIPGNVLSYQPKVYKVHVITLSDRASQGIYEDQSGPRVKQLVQEFFDAKDLPVNIELFLIKDDAAMLKTLITQARRDLVDFIFTTGGTGIGSRDITPDVVKSLLDKEIPGIMEMIRTKSGAEKPAALLSRGIAGILEQTMIFTLPGSLKAVNEYMQEIVKVMMHAKYMIHNLDLHG
jgi:molybdopterin adenylyltransferase